MRNPNVAGPSPTLRPPRHDDVVPYTEFLADPEVAVWLDDSAQVPLSAARVEAILFRDAWCLWAIECDGTFAGVTSLYHPDLVRGIARYSIVIGDRTRWGQGVGAAVTQQVTEYGFATLGLRKIEADVLEPDTAARAMLKRAGFAEDGRLRKDAWRRGQWVDRFLFSLLHEEWRQRNQA